MKRLSLLILIFVLCSCQTLPLINSPVSPTGEKLLTCPSPFLKSKYRFIHTIETRMAGNTQSAIIGVTLADPSTRSISCAIMTAEGMVMFDAESGPGGLKIDRALPPFDSAGFAENMIEDIKLIFFSPVGKIQTSGYLPDGATVCRYLEENGDWIDVIANKSEGVQIKRYSSAGILKRQVKFKETAGNIYQSIELQAYETFDYTLLMNLIEAQPVKGKLLRTKSSRNMQK
jgi:hypothetical protein